MLSQRKYLLPVVVLLCALAGCGSDGPRVVRVSGILSHKGKPVPHTVLQFLPENGRQSWAETDNGGRFKVNYDRHQDGAVVGKHKVWLEYRPPPGVETEPGMPARSPPLSKEMKDLYARYTAEKSTLKVNIERSTSDLKLELE
jgi:hypothetical protein